MTLDVQTMLPLYALGVLDADEARRLEEALADDPRLRRDLALLREGLHDLPRALAPHAPPAHLLERLLASSGGGPFEKFAGGIMKLFDVAIDRAREILGLIHDPGKWHPATPGVALIHFRGGPAHVGADCGIIKVAPGTGFPWHAHKGEEVTLFLAGVGRDHAGVIHVAGGELEQVPGRAHDFTSIGDEDLIFAVRYRGVDFAAKKP
jgi:hypothetical protein